MKMEEFWDFADSYSTDTSEHLSKKVKRQLHAKNKNLDIQLSILSNKASYYSIEDRNLPQKTLEPEKKLQSSPIISIDLMDKKDFENRVGNISKFLGFI